MNHFILHKFCEILIDLFLRIKIFNIFCVYTFFVLSSFNFFSLIFLRFFGNVIFFTIHRLPRTSVTPSVKFQKIWKQKNYFKMKKKVKNDLQKIMRHELEILDDHCKRNLTNNLTYISFFWLKMYNCLVPKIGLWKSKSWYK